MTWIWSRRRQPRPRFARKALTVMLLGLGAWVAGFFWFIEQIPRRIEAPNSETDAIVVLTGGAGRLGAGLELLARGRGVKLFDAILPGGKALRALNGSIRWLAWESR